MPTIAPALTPAPQIPPLVEVAPVGDVFAALFQQLAGPIAAPEGAAVPLGAAPATGAAAPAEPEETDPAATTDGAAAPPSWGLPAMLVVTGEPARGLEAEIEVAPSAPAPKLDNPPPASPAVPGGRVAPLAASPVTYATDGDVEPLSSAGVVGAASSPAETPAPGFPVPPSAEVAGGAPAAALAAAGAGSVPPRPSRPGTEPTAGLLADGAPSPPIDGAAEAAPVGRVAIGLHHALPSRPPPPTAGRAVQEPNGAVVADQPAEAVVSTISAEPPVSKVPDAPVEITTRTHGPASLADGPGGAGPGPGPTPLSADLAEDSRVRLAPQLTVAIVRQATDGLERVRVQLQPEELGAIEIALEVGDDGRARAAFLAERPETVDLLRREAGHLERALREVGVEVATGGMSFASRDPHGGRDREPATPPRPPEAATPLTIGPGSPPSASRAPASRLLDLTV